MSREEIIGHLRDVKEGIRTLVILNGILAAIFLTNDAQWAIITSFVIDAIILFCVCFLFWAKRQIRKIDNLMRMMEMDQSGGVPAQYGRK